MEQLLLELLPRREAVGEYDESLFDTVVREKMGAPVSYGSIKPEPEDVLPVDSGVPEEDNLRIKAALGSHIERGEEPGSGSQSLNLP